ncbi:MAG TPA: alpha/beta hydrolase [Steroidobacteraceae bacterium]
MSVPVWLQRLAQRVLFAVAGAAALLSIGLVPAVAQVGAAKIPWGNVACDAPSAQLPDPASGPQQCAYIQVPLDYRNPAGQQIQLAVSIVHADPAKRRGVLFLNVGGPGGQGLNAPRLFYALLQGTLGQATATAVLSQYDLIGFDPRFVGRSTGTTCQMTEQQADQAFPPLEQNHSFAATAAFVKHVADGCAQSNAIPFATTANTARDMDLIRQRLGEDKINYLAWSYGSYLGSVYATLFPNNTDRVVIDSVVDPNWVWREQFRSWGSGGAIRWPDFANWAAANDATYHFGNTPDKVTASYYQLYAKADANPYPYPDVFSDGTLVNGPVFRELTFANLEHDSFFPQLAAVWQAAMSASSGEASSGEASSGGASSGGASSSKAGSAAARSAVPASLMPIPVDNPAASGLSVVCNDVAWSRSPGQYHAEYESDIESYPMFGALGSNIYPCAYWSTAPLEPPVQITSNGPRNILMLQNLRDPNTPYAGAQEMRSALGQRAVMVSVDEGGHAIFGFESNSCVNDAAVAYLGNGVLPAQDTFCAAEATSTAETQVTPERLRALRQAARQISGLPRGR